MSDRSQLERNAAKALTAILAYKGDKRRAEYKLLQSELNDAHLAILAFDRAAENAPEPAAPAPKPAWFTHALSEDTLNSLSRMIIKHCPTGRLPVRDETNKSFHDAIVALNAIMTCAHCTPDCARAIARLVMRDLRATNTPANIQLAVDVAAWFPTIEAREVQP